MTAGLLCPAPSPPALLPPHPALPSTPAQLLVVRGKCSYPGTLEWSVVSLAGSRRQGVTATLCPLREPWVGFSPTGNRVSKLVVTALSSFLGRRELSWPLSRFYLRVRDRTRSVLGLHFLRAGRDLSVGVQCLLGAALHVQALVAQEVGVV